MTRGRDGAEMPGKMPRWLAARVQPLPAWLDAEITVRQNEAAIAAGRAGLAAIEAAQQERWRRNAAGRAAGEASWRAANERMAARNAGATPLAPAASGRFWPHEPAAPGWIR